MLATFETKKQKEDCLLALRHSILLWERMADTGSYSKVQALGSLKWEGAFPPDTAVYGLRFGCFLCDNTELQMMLHKDFGDLDCARYCPVLWDKKNNPNNGVKKDYGSPCCCGRSPYNTWRRADTPEKRKKAAAGVLQLLKETLEQAEKMPIQKERKER